MLGPRTKQSSPSLGGILESNVTKVNSAARANAQRYASVQRFGEVKTPSVNASQFSARPLGSSRYPTRQSDRKVRYICHDSDGLMTSSCITCLFVNSHRNANCVIRQNASCSSWTFANQ